MSTSSPLLILHISAALVGLLSGFMAMLFRKGSGLHGAAGTVFFVSMLCMSSSAAYIAKFIRPNDANFMVAVLTFYLVATAWVTAKRRDGKPGLFDRVALLVVLVDGLVGVSWGFQEAGSEKALYFIFGSIALLCAALDFRMIRRGGFVGPKRIARHLLRMGFALLLTTFSFYPGQARLFSAAVRSTGLLFVPHVVLIGLMLFWIVRVRRSRAPRKAIGGDPAWRAPATAVAHPLMERT